MSGWIRACRSDEDCRLMPAVLSPVGKASRLSPEVAASVDVFESNCETGTVLQVVVRGIVQ